MPSEIFNTVGEHNWSLPNGGILRVHSILLGAGASGNGARVEDQFETQGDNTITLRVGGSGGYNGGGSGNQAGENVTNGQDGAGATDIRVNGTSLTDRVLVAGGGGGSGGGANNGGDAGWIGQGGGSDGSAGGGGGGTQTSGGGAASGAFPGSLGQGGDAQPSSGTNINGGGGGGAGYYGGGGGENGFDSSVEDGAGGGGGSSLATDQSKVTDGFNAGDGEVSLFYVARATNPSISSTSSDVTLSWDSITDTDVDSIEIYRSTSSGIDVLSSSPLTTLSSGSTSYTDSTVDEGTTYYYKVVTTGSNAEVSESVEVSDTTALPQISNFVTGNITDTTFDVSWTLNSTDENGIRVYRSLSGGSYSQIADLSAGTQSYADSGLLNGRDYTYYLELYGNDVSNTTSTVSGQTVLNNPFDIISDSQNRGEVAVEWDSELNNGDFYIELENLDTQSLTDTATVDYQTKTVTFTQGIDDAVEYEVRVRSETQDTTGNSVSETIISFLPSPRIISLEFTGEEKIIIEYDKTDNFAGGNYELYKSETTGNLGELVKDTEDSSQGELIDHDVEPNKDYYYTIRRVVE